MPNSLGIVHPGMLTPLAAAFFPSKLTIQAATSGRSPTGAVLPFWGNVAGMVDLPCRVAPVSGAENRTPEQVLAQDVRLCVVPGNLVGVTVRHQALVDGAAYDIVSVDHDGQNPPRLTRLMLKVVT